MAAKAAHIAFSFLFLFFAACTAEISYNIVLQNGEYSLGDEAASIAENFYLERRGVDLDAVFPFAITILDDGSAAVYDSDNTELFRVFSFGSEDWIAVIPQGFFTVPSGTFANAASRLAIKTKKEQFALSQFSSFFFRPDIVEAHILGEKTEMPETLLSLLSGEKRPPQVALFDRTETGLNVKVKSGEAGGYLALWQSNETLQDNAPFGFTAMINLEERATKKYREKGLNVYEVFLDEQEFDIYQSLEDGRVGVSAFSPDRTMESELVWKEYSSRGIGKQNYDDVDPVLHLLFSGGLDNKMFSGMSELFSIQDQGSQYSGVKIHREFPAEVNEQDVFVFFHAFPASVDKFGDYVFFDPNTDAAQSSWEFIEKILDIKARRFILMLDARDLSPIAEQTAFARLVNRLGNRAIMANCSFGGESTDMAFNIPASIKRYMSAAEFISLVQENSPGQIKKTTFFPGEDFTLLDTHIGFGEIRMQTMFSGMLNIAGVDGASSPLTFGETMIRRLPAGNYTLTMTYRNGRRETKTAELAWNSTRWVVFTYTPELLEGDFSRLPSFGVNISELNPANYRRADPAVLRAMEVPAWQVAFIAGEDFYRNEKYNEAIAEYTKTISLKNDYTAAYASRGNAYRRMGNAARAIDDYTRALRLKPDYAELYNYRGYLYSQRGDFAGAIRDYSQAINYRADYADAIFNRAYAHAKQGNHDRAIEDYSRVIRLEPRNAVAYRERGRVWQSKGDEAKANADLERAAALGNR